MADKLITTGSVLRTVTGWEEIDFVDDDAEVVVHFGHEGAPYALWTDARGAAQTLGTLTSGQLAALTEVES